MLPRYLRTGTWNPIGGQRIPRPKENSHPSPRLLTRIRNPQPDALVLQQKSRSKKGVQEGAEAKACRLPHRLAHFPQRQLRHPVSTTHLSPASSPSPPFSFPSCVTPLLRFFPFFHLLFAADTLLYLFFKNSLKIAPKTTSPRATTIARS